METIIIVIAVMAAALFLVRSLYRSTTGKGGACDCGGTCPHANTCEPGDKPGNDGPPER